MVSEKSIILKLIHGYKSLKIKNKDNLIDKKSLLFAINSAINNLFI